MNMRVWGKPLMAVGLIALICVGVAMRSNALARAIPDIPHEEYEVGEWIDLSHVFVSTKGDEHADGYRVRVDGAEIMTPNQYLARHAVDGVSSYDEGGYVAEANMPVILAVRVTIKNEENDEGALSGIRAWQWQIVPESNVGSYTVIGELFAHAYPEVGDGLEFSVKRGDEQTAVFPFALQQAARYFEKKEVRHLAEVPDGRFRLTLSNLPVCKRAVFAPEG